MKYTKQISTWANVGLYIFYGLLAYMPLHILLSTWVGTSFGVLEAAKVLKDVVLVGGFLIVLLSSAHKSWFRQLAKSKFVWAILLYALWTLILAMVRPTDQDAEILGVVYNLRFLVFFLYGFLLARLHDTDSVRRMSVRIVLVAGAIVVGFGLIQYTVLPDDALRHLGYQRANGVLPAFFIDDKPDLERVMSTLRDPNSLGSYLIIIAPLAAAGLFVYKIARDKLAPSLLLAGSVFCLWFTFSRSAWLGFVAAMVVFFLLTDSTLKIELYKRKAVLIPGLVIALAMVLAGLVAYKDSYLVQNVILHADQSTVLEDPNELRIRFFRESLEGIKDDPVGSGPGTAGLASIRNDKQGTELNENYYLQIASEVGIIGLGLFMAILLAAGRRLYDMRHDSYIACALLASFAGLLITNFLVHIWASEAVTYTWWGLAALTIASRRFK